MLKCCGLLLRRCLPSLGCTFRPRPRVSLRCFKSPRRDLALRQLFRPSKVPQVEPTSWTVFPTCEDLIFYSPFAKAGSPDTLSPLSTVPACLLQFTTGRWRRDRYLHISDQSPPFRALHSSSLTFPFFPLRPPPHLLFPLPSSTGKASSLFRYTVCPSFPFFSWNVKVHPAGCMFIFFTPAFGQFPRAEQWPLQPLSR